VAAAIERLHVDRLVEHVERLAHHARQGEVWDKAVRYLRQAGIKGFLRSANREAAGFSAGAGRRIAAWRQGSWRGSG
jgi:hypothetical protein